MRVFPHWADAFRRDRKRGRVDQATLIAETRSVLSVEASPTRFNMQPPPRKVSTHSQSHTHIYTIIKNNIFYLHTYKHTVTKTVNELHIMFLMWRVFIQLCNKCFDYAQDLRDLYLIYKYFFIYYFFFGYCIPI